ncbi:MAG: Rnf-Nqr domain containing protein [Alphaproteobacteria bacterium]
MEYLVIFISSIFVNNIVLSQFLGVGSFLIASKKTSTALLVGLVITLVMMASTTVNYVVYKNFLLPNGLEFLNIMAFILVIATLVQVFELMLKKGIPSLYAVLGVFLPSIMTNCVVLGMIILAFNKNYDFSRSIAFAIANGLGFTLAVVLFASLRERIDEKKVPDALKGAPIALIVASILSMAFMGFAGFAG